MENKLKLNEIYFGKTDAYNEFITYGRETFKELFYTYPAFQVEKFMKGKAYYICGDKGTGKTMLLKYIESRANEKPTENFTEFIRFKKDVDNDARNQLKRASIPQNPFEEIIEKTIPSDITVNCSLAWQIYIIKVIMFRLQKTEQGVFVRDESFYNLIKILNIIYNDESQDVKHILPQIKRGNVEINFAELAKINLEFEWADEGKKAVAFSLLAKKILSMYTNLIPTDCNIYILFDELELTLNKNKDYERDLTLIRDLIMAVQYQNEISQTKFFNVFICMSLRSEVYRSAISRGFEINKPIHDFGVQISWEQKGGDLNEHPLIKMVERKIQKSEIDKFGLSGCDVWKEYFVQNIGNEPIKNYILNLTWFKPRDLIRLLTIAQEIHGEKHQITQAVLDSSRKRYAEECWDEFAEALRAKYTDDEVEGIKQTLIGISVPFEVSDFSKRAKEKKNFFPEVEALWNSQKKMSQIMIDLYNLGIIGNYGRNPAFIFRGDKDFDPLALITIHYPLTRFFKVNYIKIGDHNMEDLRMKISTKTSGNIL